MKQRLMDLYFTEGADLSNEAGAGAGRRRCRPRSGRRARRGLDSDKDIAEIEQEVNAAKEAGVQIPCFILDGKYAISGAGDRSTGAGDPAGQRASRGIACRAACPRPTRTITSSSGGQRRLRSGQPADRVGRIACCCWRRAADRNPWLHIPLGYGRLFTDRRYNWCYTTEPQPECHDRKMIAPRGKVLGGSSSINGLIYIRGQAEDFDHWRQLGNAGWGFDDVLPYFRKAEDNERGADEFHGAGGPLARFGRARPASARAGLCRGGAAVRLSAQRRFQRRGAGRRGLLPDHDAQRRALLDRGGAISSRRAAGNLQVVSEGARHARPVRRPARHRRRICRSAATKRSARANVEVIVASGAFNSPQLLQLSGLGPASLLQSLGIAGDRRYARRRRRSQRSYFGRIILRCKEPITLNDAVRNWQRQAAAGCAMRCSAAVISRSRRISAGCFLRALPLGDARRRNARSRCFRCRTSAMSCIRSPA